MDWRKDFDSIPEWERVEVSSIRRVPAHTRWEAYDSAEEAAKGGLSRNKLSLNGEWQFKLEKSPEEVGDFYREDAALSGFSPIAVPGSWEVQGFGKPIYTNVPYPWDYRAAGRHMIRPSLGDERQFPNPPYIPADNPTGCYRRSFTLPAHFAGKEVFLRFDGVETAFYLWVNGEPAGYSEDSKLPAEFNVTEFLRSGENTVSLAALRFSKSSYLEDQDYWHISGIHRDVWLIAKPALCIEDYQITALPDLHRGGGEVTTDIRISRRPGFADCRVRLSIVDTAGQMLAQGEGPVMESAQYRMDCLPTANTGRVTLRLPEVKLWSPETPSLYRAVITLVGPDGAECDWESCRFGFKKIEVADGVVLLNGQRLLIRGVNRHDFCWEGGRTVSRAHMMEEIRQMKRMNINSVRTCHYPDCPEWYDLCDELGLLLVCECNLETHGVMGALSHDPAWAGQYLERAVRMVSHYKNHPSIYSWSLGNESGTGPNHAAMYGFIKEFDPTRLCQYEAGEPGKNVSDVRGNMYATIPRILQMLASPADSRPVILVEYLYQICNSGGGMEKFRELLERYPRFQGGYIWDWQDKSLVGKTADGKKFFAYGGDFGEPVVEWQNPPYMTNNGIVQADLTWKPVAYEVKEAYCPIWMEKPQNFSAWDTAAPDLRFVLKNRTMTQRGRDFRCEAVLREDGAEVSRWELALPDLAPMSETEITVTLPFSRREAHEYHLEFCFSRRKDCWFAAAGEEMGFQQFAVAGGLCRPAALPAHGAAPKLSAGNELLNVDAGALTAVFRKQDGALVSLQRGGKEFLAGASSPAFARPRTGLDCCPGWGWHDLLAPFRDMEVAAQEPVILNGTDRVRIEFPFVMQGGVPAEGRLCYTVQESGVETEFSVSLPDSLPAVPRVGILLPIAAGLEKITAYGRGPQENYVDRKLAARVQVWESTVLDQHFPFSPPSENGGHEETRWLQLQDHAGHMLKVRAEKPFHFDIRHNTVAEYSADHEHELPVHRESWLHIDAAHGPIGGDMAWSTAMPKEYQLTGGLYTLRFTLEIK